MTRNLFGVRVALWAGLLAGAVGALGAGPVAAQDTSDALEAIAKRFADDRPGMVIALDPVVRCGRAACSQRPEVANERVADALGSRRILGLQAARQCSNLETEAEACSLAEGVDGVLQLSDPDLRGRRRGAARAVLHLERNGWVHLEEFYVEMAREQGQWVVTRIVPVRSS